MSQGANIHAQEEHALIYSAEKGHINVVKFLVELGANIHAQEEHALISSSANGHLNVVKFLVSQGANIHADLHLDIVHIMVT